MSTIFRRNRKSSDRDITRLNAMGFSLNTIGERLKCHPTSITLRLKGLGIRPADTRRSFMEDIYNDIGEELREKIGDTLEDRSVSIKEYVKSLILNDIGSRLHNQATSEPAFA